VHPPATRARQTFLREAVRGDGRRTLLQPIYEISTGDVVGVEALTAFSADHPEGTAGWFQLAWSTGLGVDLEFACIGDALALVPRIPAHVWLACKASPATTADPRLAALLDTVPAPSVVVELTGDPVAPEGLAAVRALDGLRARGLQLAVDDYGAGRTGPHWLLEVEPNIVKVDRSLIKGVGSDHRKQALTRALVRFAADTGCALVAEGVESRDDLEMVAACGVVLAQGFHLARPEPAETFLPRGADPLR
jgi:EAL domain-containing protein (putative c-di-GMP-specific phosphodiesterase class I)